MARGIRTVCAALAVAAGAVAAPAQAEDAFVLTGSGSGWVDVELPGKRTYDLPGAEVRTSGRYGGFVAEQLSSTYDESTVGRVTGYVALRALTTDGSLPDAEPVGLPQLTSGLVRFYLVADGPTTVRIPDPGSLPARTLRPRHPAATALQVVPLRRAGDAWGAEAPFAAPARSTTLVGVVATGDRVGLADARFCVAKRGTGCEENALSPLRRVGSRPATPDGAPFGARYWLAAYSSVPAAPAARFSVAAVPPLATVARAYGVRFSLTRA